MAHDGRILVPVSALLREARRRLHPEVKMLGTSERLRNRVGKPVTQEEVAEAAGVSRVWYVKLETGAAPRVSTVFLGRVADVLMLDEAERANLFRLAVPELSSARIRPAVMDALGSLTRLRSFSKRLWTASDETEALTLATEEISAVFNDSLVVVATVRRENGRWEQVSVLGKPDFQRKVKAVWSDMTSGTLEETEEAVLHPVLPEAGDVGTMASYTVTSVKDRVNAVLTNHGLASEVIIGKVRSRSDFVANILARHPPDRQYSQIERTWIGSLASLTSLALK